MISALKKIRSEGIFISLCTAKPHFAIKDIIEDANLDNFHITDDGGVIIDPIDNTILKSNILSSVSAINVIEMFLKNNVYVEYYTIDNYYVQENQICDITKKHEHVLQTRPKIVKSLAASALFNKITKVIPIAKDEEDKKRSIEIFKPFEEDLVISWGVHPVALPLQFGIITAYGISKKNAWEDIIKNENVSFDEVLGIGDSTSDFQFIEQCRFGAAMGNASEELKRLVLSKSKDNSYIGLTVDDKGIIDIFKHFGLLE